MGFAAEDILRGGLHFRHTGHTADEDHFIDLAGVHIGIAHAVLARGLGAFQQGIHQLFELRAAHGHLQVNRTAFIHGDEGKADIRGHAGGEFDLCFFCGIFKTLQRLSVLAQVHIVFLHEVFGNVVDDRLVEVVAAQVGIAVGGFHFKDAVADFEDGDIEGTAAQVVNCDRFILALVHTVCQSSGGGFVDDAFHIQTGDSAGIFGCLTLGVIEVCGDRDDGFRDLFAEERFRIGFELLQDHSGDFGRSVHFAACHDAGIAVLAFHHFIGGAFQLVLHFVEFSAHEALHGENGVLGVGDSLAFGSLTHEAFAVFRECHNGGRGVGAFRIGDDLECVAVHHSHTAVGRTEVDSENFAHNFTLSCLLGFVVFCSCHFRIKQTACQLFAICYNVKTINSLQGFSGTIEKEQKKKECDMLSHSRVTVGSHPMTLT